MPSQIALYRADGHLVDWISEERLARLQRVGMIARTVRPRNRNISRAYMFVRSGEGRVMEVRDYLGTRYSFRERLDDGHLVWALRKPGNYNDVCQAHKRVVID